MADRFYTSFSLSPGPVLLQGAEAHHLATVRRFSPGDRVTLFNGDGHEYPAEVVSADRKTVSLNVLGVESPDRELPFSLEVAAPLPKGDRGDFLIEKLTELGVTDFTPLITRRSVVVPREGKQEKLTRAVIEASKQCGRNRLMQVHPAANWSEYCRRSDLPQVRLLAHPTATTPLHTAPGSCCIAVGPEGGFTAEEVADALAAGWQSVSLGPRILRVETAAVALTAVLILGFRA